MRNFSKRLVIISIIITLVLPLILQSMTIKALATATEDIEVEDYELGTSIILQPNESIFIEKDAFSKLEPGQSCGVRDGWSNTLYMTSLGGDILYDYNMLVRKV